MDAPQAPPEPTPTPTPTPHLPGFVVPPKDEPNEVHARYEARSLYAQCLIFMGYVNQFFAEHSPESNRINQALNEFRMGRLSKRDAYGTMTAMLGDNDDLKHALSDVLSHSDANWGPGHLDEQEAVPATTAADPRASYVIPSRFATQRSFSPALPGTDILPTNVTDMDRPALLQPQHQPQMRLRPVSAAWSSNQYVLPQAFNSALLEPPLTHYISDRRSLTQQRSTNMVDNTHTGHDIYHGYGSDEAYGDQGQNHQTYAQNTHVNWTPFPLNGNLSTPPPLPSEVPLAHHYASATFGPTASPNLYADTGYGTGFSSPVYGVVEHAHRSPYPSHESWQQGNTHPPWTDAEPHHSHEGLHAFNGYQQVQSSLVPYQEPTPKLASSHQNSPCEPPSEWETHTAVPSGQPAHDEMLPPPKKRSRNNPSNHQRKDTQANSKPRRTRMATGPGQFVHAICGKGFPTRSGVKKHHWGSKVDDVSTTTGCWAKHDKPNREWDEHPSCKQDIANPRSLKPMPTRSKAEELQQFKAPVVPAMIPNPSNTIPGFPILQELPKTVAETVNAMPVFDGKPVPYNASRLPMSSSFDSFVTAVNAVPKVDAPIPQSRNDSVVSRLDARATAAEHNTQPLLSPKLSNPDGRHAFHSREQYPLAGSGIAQTDGVPASLDTVPFSQDEKAVSSEMQQAPTSLGMETVAVAPGKDGRPHRKKQKV